MFRHFRFAYATLAHCAKWRRVESNALQRRGKVKQRALRAKTLMSGHDAPKRPFFLAKNCQTTQQRKETAKFHDCDPPLV